MSEGVQASPDVPRGGSRIRDPRDFYGGLALIALGVFALWASRDLPGMHGFAFGPGTAPRMFAIVLIGLGAIITGIGLVTEGAVVERYEISGPTLINLAYIFAVSAQTFTYKMVALALLVLGLVLSVIGLMGPKRNLVRGPLFITLSILVFAISASWRLPPRRPRSAGWKRSSGAPFCRRSACCCSR
jgi:putative tricarboxylic transport membrane protein